jgi:hypothetical protein
MADEQTISRVFNGVTLTGTYTLQDDIVTVTTAFGNKTAQLLGSNLAILASIMLRELYEDIASNRDARQDRGGEAFLAGIRGSDGTAH